MKHRALWLVASLLLGATAHAAPRQLGDPPPVIPYKGKCDWGLMYDATPEAIQCWPGGDFTAEPADGDVILMTGGKEFESSADPCSPEGRSDDPPADNGTWPAVLCVYADAGFVSQAKRWRALDSSGGGRAGRDDYYQGVAPAQNYSDVSYVIYTRPYNTTGGGPLENGGLLIACNEDGTYGTDNECDPLAIADVDGDLVVLFETTTPNGEPRLTLFDASGVETARYEADGWSFVAVTGTCANAPTGQKKLCNDDGALAVYDSSGLVDEVMLADDALQPTGVATHGHIAFGDSSDSFDTGTEVCAALNSMSCAGTYQMDGTSQTCAYDHGTATVHFQALCY